MSKSRNEQITVLNAYLYLTKGFCYLTSFSESYLLQEKYRIFSLYLTVCHSFVVAAFQLHNFVFNLRIASRKGWLQIYIGLLSSFLVLGQD